jgi:hypothetical protein
MARMKHSAMSSGILDAAIKKLKLKKPSQNTVPAKAALLKAHFKEHTKAEDLSECTNCGGESDFNLEACPYCGDSEKTSDATAITTTAEALPEVEQVSTEALDEAVTRVKQLKRNTEVSIWELGTEIAHIHDDGLWKTRMLGPNPQYKTFKAFVNAELGISHTHAYSLMEVAKKFSRDQVEQIGVSKLAIIVQLPPDKQAAALAGNKSKADLARELAESKGGSDKQPDVVSVMTRMGSRQKLPMQGTNSKGKPAESLADEPWVEEEHENGIISRYVVKLDPKTKQIVLIITRRRAT